MRKCLGQETSEAIIRRSDSARIAVSERERTTIIVIGESTGDESGVFWCVDISRRGEPRETVIAVGTDIACCIGDRSELIARTIGIRRDERCCVEIFCGRAEVSVGVIGEFFDISERISDSLSVADIGDSRGLAWCWSLRYDTTEDIVGGTKCRSRGIGCGEATSCLKDRYARDGRISVRIIPCRGNTILSYFWS